MKKFLFLLIFLTFTIRAQSIKKDSLRVKASLSLTGFFQAGNVETIIFRANSDFNFIPFNRWDFRTKNSYVYQEFGKTKADEDFLSLNFLSYNPNKKIYPFVLGFASTNHRRDINWRTLFGAGFAFQILKSKVNELKFSLSNEYEETAFGSSIFNHDNYFGMTHIKTFRSTFWMNGKHQLFKKKLILKHEFFVQPSLENENNFRWQGDLGIEMPLWKFLNFKINYLHTFESLVIKNQKQEDKIFTFGFTIKNHTF